MSNFNKLEQEKINEIKSFLAKKEEIDERIKVLFSEYRKIKREEAKFLNKEICKNCYNLIDDSSKHFIMGDGFKKLAYNVCRELSFRFETNK